MDKEMLIKKELKNAEGKRLLKKAKMDYSKEIINRLQENPEKIDELLDCLEVTKKDFFNYISGDKDNNITFYDQALILAKKKKWYNE